jgi:hypothetical protein
MLNVIMLSVNMLNVMAPYGGLYYKTFNNANVADCNKRSDIQHNDIQHNGTQHEGFTWDIQHN